MRPRLRQLTSRRIPNGYDTTAFVRDEAAGLAFRARYGIRSASAVVLTSAKLTRNKGHDVAIEALDRVRREGIDLVYVVCGDGSREAELRGLAADQSFPIIFTGLLDPQEMVAALSARRRGRSSVAEGDLSQRRRRGDVLRLRGGRCRRRRHRRAARQ